MTFKTYAYILAVLGLIQITACMPPLAEKKQTDVSIDYTDLNVQKLYTFQDKLLADSLVTYFGNKNPTYRYLSAMAFASVKDRKALPGLESLLKDDVDKVRCAAAYSLGQIADSTSSAALIGAFQAQDTLRKAMRFNATILEAVGKCGTAKHLQALATISTYNSSDTILLEGQAYGIYRFATRAITSPKGTSRMLTLVNDTKMPQSVRFIASNYLSRAKDIVLDSTAGMSLAGTFQNEQDYRIRMTLANALGKAKCAASYQALYNQFYKESDYRVKSAIIKAFGNYDYATVQPMITGALRDKNPHIANAAARFFIDSGNSEDVAATYWPMAKDSTLLPSTQLLMYQATNRHVPTYMENTRSWVNAEIFRKFQTVQSPTEKILALKAMAEFGWNYKYIREQGFINPSFAVRTASVDALKDICNNPTFYKFFGNGAKPVRINMFSYFVEAMNGDDVGMKAVAADALRIPAMGFKYFYDNMSDKSFLINAQNKLKMPRDIEAWNSIQETIDNFNGVPFTPKKLDYNQPIEWKLFNSIGPNPVATIETAYGSITLDLFKKQAPGSVLNFISLANNGFYNGKTFHRVVSNFVIQAGCPRGDGYGALDYSIRSELYPSHYDQEGMVGMASAGNHTEGTQFFINNAPAPHLDGNYTIFAKVTSGMDVVQKIQQGDAITRVTIK
jgi:cyclophilin family peptidyl-prolyl cis-trans isomerase/HEAT repeat protein